MMGFIFVELFDKEFWMGTEEWKFLWEIILRTSVMFLIIILGIKILGKRGVKQLSIFELVVIIGLGSAAGDPMFYKDTGILSAVFVFIVVITLYRLVTFLVENIHPFEIFMEGKPHILIKEGEFYLKNSKKEDLGTEELFSALRIEKVSQLGQIKLAIEEISGEISVFFYEDKNVKYGLPILPGVEISKVKWIESEDYYSCTFCAHTEMKEPGEAGKCVNCGKDEWVKSNNEKRIS